jgi:hypothetical protein
MDLTVLPIQQCPKSNIFALIYGEGGTGKGQYALRLAHRLTASGNGIIVAVEADGDRMRRHARRPDGTGFLWRPIKFPVANPDRLTKVIGELADAAEAATVPVAVIVDGASRFWNDPGGFKDRAEEYGGTNSKGQANLRGWGPVKAEEKALYNNLHRLKAHAHIIMCFEQTPEFVKQEPVGVKLDARKGITHEADFIFRMERHLKQEDTAHETNLKKGAADVHRAIVEKTALVKLRPKDDGLADFKYPMPTGTVFVDPGPAVADLMLAELDGIDNTLEAETSAYLEQLKSADYRALHEAWLWVRDGSWWPQEAKDKVNEAIAALGKQAAAGNPEPAPAKAAEPRYAWQALTMNSRIEEWTEAAEKILDADTEELQAFKEHAQVHQQYDTVAGHIHTREEELKALEDITA